MEEPAKRFKRIDESRVPGSPFAVFSIDDFDAGASSSNTELAEKIAPDHPGKRAPELLDIVSNAVINMIDQMKTCGYNPMYETPNTVRISEEDNAQLAELALQACQSASDIVHGEHVAIRNVTTRAGMSVKYHLREPLSGEPPLCNADYHQAFLRTPVSEWERPCCFGERGQCEGQTIVNCEEPLREFLLPAENDALLASLEEEGAVPVLPDREPVCLLCDRRITSIFAANHEAGNPLYKFTDEDTYKVGNVRLLSANGYPLTINTHKVVHGEPGGYMTDRVIQSNQGGKVPGLVGPAINYLRSDYKGEDHTADQGCKWVDQSRLLFPIASIAH